MRLWTALCAWVYVGMALERQINLKEAEVKSHDTRIRERHGEG